MPLSHERFRRVVERERLDALIATTNEHVYYSTDYYGLGHWIMPRSTQAFAILPSDAAEKPHLVCSVGAADTALEVRDHLGGVTTFGTFFYEQERDALRDVERELRAIAVDRPPAPDPVAALVRALGDLKLDRARIGLDERGLLPGVFEQVREALPGAELRPAFALWQEVRLVKTPEEIERLHRAATIAEQAIQAALAVCREGLTEAEMAHEYERAIVERGARPAFTVIGFGDHSAHPNALPGQTRLEKGDLIRFDVGCLYKQYWSDISRTAVFGEPTAEQRRKYAAILEGEERGIRAMRPGVAAEEVFRAALEGTRAAGLPGYRRHHVGHGIGIYTYDPPILAPGVRTPLEPGMVFEIETPYYELGFGGLQVEDTMLVTEDGARMLTTLDRDLLVV
jgi:Xaa-Pro dipeptidase